MNRLLQCSFESAKAQVNDGYPQLIAGYLAEIKDTLDEYASANKVVTDVAFAQPALKKIEKATKERFGLPLTIIYTPFLSQICNVMVPRVEGNHVLSPLQVTDFKNIDNKEWTQTVEKLTEAYKQNKIIINTKTAKVKGFPKGSTNYLYINLSSLFYTYKLTVGEVAALILHEIGHVFTYLENMDRISKLNILLSENLDTHLEGKELVEFSYKVRDQIPSMEGKKQYMELTDGTQKIVWAMTTYKIFINAFNSSNTDGNGELLADRFVGALGSSKELSSALDKVYAASTDFTELNYYSQFTAYCAIGILVLLVLDISVFLPALLLMAIYLTTRKAGDSDRDMTYPSTLARVTNLKYQLIEQLRFKVIPDKEKMGILNELKDIDTTLSNIKEPSAVFTKLANILIFRNRKIKLISDVEKELESIVANNLYIRQQELKKFV